MLGNDNVNPIERELSNVIGNSENHCGIESNSQFRENNPYENGFGHYVHEDIIPRQDRFQETMENFTSEFNMRLSQEMDSMVSMMHNQMNRARSSAIAERVIPQIQNIVSSMLQCHLPEIGTPRLLRPIIGRKTQKEHMGSKLKLQKRTLGLLVI